MPFDFVAGNHGNALYFHDFSFDGASRETRDQRWILLRRKSTRRRWAALVAAGILLKVVDYRNDTAASRESAPGRVADAEPEAGRPAG